MRELIQKFYLNSIKMIRNSIYKTLSIFNPIFKWKHRNNLRVLAYHKVPSRIAFEKQLSFLEKNYNLVTPNQVLDSIYNESVLPENAVLLTFDDGDISVYENGLTALNEKGVSAILFIITALIDTSNDVWIKKVENSEMSSGKTYKESRKVVNYLKKLPNKELKLIISKYPEIKKRQLTTSQLKDFIESGIMIANHTHTHPMLDKCDEVEIEKELDSSKSFFMNSNIGNHDIFAYPNGNENELTYKILKNRRFRLVFLFDHKLNDRKINPLKISRIRVDSDNKLAEFSVKVSGLHPFIHNLRN